MAYRINDAQRMAILSNDLLNVTEAELARWAADDDCLDKDICAKALSDRPAMLEAKIAAIAGSPFNRRVDVSADARHVVKHLWILFFLLPVLVGLLWIVIAIFSPPTRSSSGF